MGNCFILSCAVCSIDEKSYLLNTILLVPILLFPLYVILSDLDISSLNFTTVSEVNFQLIVYNA